MTIAPDLPRVALAVRQPWAWAIIHAGKPVENRSVGAINYLRAHRGRCAICASKGMTRYEYDEAREFMQSLGVEVPPADELWRGGIIGSVDVFDVVRKSDSPWFFGPYALALRDPLPCNFVPSDGQLGYWFWKPSGGTAEPPARWMMPGSVRKPGSKSVASGIPDLFEGDR